MSTLDGSMATADEALGARISLDATNSLVNGKRRKRKRAKQRKAYA